MEIEYVVKEYFDATFCHWHDSLSIVWDCYCLERQPVKITVTLLELPTVD